MTANIEEIVYAMRRMRVHDAYAAARRLSCSGRPWIHTEADRIMWWKLYLSGESIADIARKYECHKTTIRQDLGLDRNYRQKLKARRALIDSPIRKF